MYFSIFSIENPQSHIYKLINTKKALQENGALFTKLIYQALQS
ncbi:hypothetical protein BAOM_2720 [Peribacillus asahii]|uniref:Uncharacterized protein n=1 Tax=Peribacillus asahii TaxID=228899 RepID=A0A3T0KSC9_9BACI|nr:hypothetical protein BAOM_2720 [Peribacillus asahii]